VRIPGLYGIEPRSLVRQTYEQLRTDDVLTYAAALAFHGLLAMFPFLIFLVGLLSYIERPEFFAWLLDRAAGVLPRQAMEQVRATTREIEQQRQGGLLSIGILGAIWVASGGVRCAMTVLNRAYGVRTGRPVWKRYLLSLVYTVGLATLVVVAVALMLIGPRAVAWIAGLLRVDDLIVTLWQWIRFPVAVLALMVAASLVYTVLPKVEGFHLLTPGSVIAVILWLAASLGFQVYTSNFGNYDAFYGSIGAVVVLLLYLWISAAVLLLGAEVNAVVRRLRVGTGTARRAEPTGRGGMSEIEQAPALPSERS
jgi:membrane protein